MHRCVATVNDMAAVRRRARPAARPKHVHKRPTLNLRSAALRCATPPPRLDRGHRRARCRQEHGRRRRRAMLQRPRRFKAYPMDGFHFSRQNCATSTRRTRRRCSRPGRAADVRRRGLCAADVAEGKHKSGGASGRHRRDASSMSWRCGRLPLDSTSPFLAGGRRG